MNWNARAALMGAILLIALFGYLWSLNSLGASVGNSVASSVRVSSIPPLRLDKLVTPGSLSGNIESLTPPESYPALAAGSYTARRQRLEEIVEQQAQLNKDDLLNSAKQQAETHRQALIEDSRQSAEKEIARLNEQYAQNQREYLTKNSLELLNKELGTIALEKSSPLFPGFEDRNGAAVLKARKQELQQMQEAHKTALEQMASEHRKAMKSVAEVYTKQAEAESESTWVDLEQKATKESELRETELRKDLRQTFDLVNSSTRIRMTTASDIETLNKRAQDVNQSIADKMRALQTAAEKARMLQEAQQRRMAQIR